MTEPKSYRPISNLSVLSKLLDRLESHQLVVYLKDNNLLPDRESAYKAHHSAATAVVRVLSDILLALDSGGIAILTLLDFSAAFDSVDQATLLQLWQTSYGLLSLHLSLSTLDRRRVVAPSMLTDPLQHFKRQERTMCCW